METCEPVTKLVEVARDTLVRLKAWEDSARITHRQTNSKASANEVQNYHYITERLVAALRPFNKEGEDRRKWEIAHHGMTGE